MGISPDSGDSLRAFLRGHTGPDDGRTCAVDSSAFQEMVYRYFKSYLEAGVVFLKERGVDKS